MTTVANVRPEKRAEFLDATLSLQRERMQEKGLVASNMYEEPEGQNLFLIVDEWETQEDLERYRRAEGFKVLVGALRTLCTDSEVRYSPSRRRDSEVIFHRHEGA